MPSRLPVAECLTPIQSAFHVGFRYGGGDAAFGDVSFGDPEQRIQHDLAEVVICPVAVVVTAGKSEASPAVRSLCGPHQSLFAATGADDVVVGPSRRDVGSL